MCPWRPFSAGMELYSDLEGAQAEPASPPSSPAKTQSELVPEGSRAAETFQLLPDVIKPSCPPEACSAPPAHRVPIPWTTIVSWLALFTATVTFGAVGPSFRVMYVPSDLIRSLLGGEDIQSRHNGLTPNQISVHCHPDAGFLTSTSRPSSRPRGEPRRRRPSSFPSRSWRSGGRQRRSGNS